MAAEYGLNPAEYRAWAKKQVRFACVRIYIYVGMCA